MKIRHFVPIVVATIILALVCTLVPGRYLVAQETQGSHPLSSSITLANKTFQFNCSRFLRWGPVTFERMASGQAGMANWEFGSFDLPTAITDPQGNKIGPGAYNVAISADDEGKILLKVTNEGFNEDEDSPSNEEFEVHLKLYNDGPVYSTYMVPSLIPQEDPGKFLLQLQCGDKMATVEFQIAQ